LLQGAGDFHQRINACFDSELDNLMIFYDPVPIYPIISLNSSQRISAVSSSLLSSSNRFETCRNLSGESAPEFMSLISFSFSYRAAARQRGKQKTMNKKYFS